MVTGDDAESIKRLKSHLHSVFDIKDLGDLKSGIEVARSKKGISLNQCKYATDPLSKSGMLAAKPSEFPMEQHHKLMAESGELIENPSMYRHLVGSLKYLTITRPDIAYAVGIVSQFMHEPRKPHLDAVYWILKYIKSNPGLLLSSAGSHRITGYSDADWAGCPKDRRSTTGYCIFIGNSLVAWKSQKQSTVARSSAEAEYRAMASTACELIWMKALLWEIGLRHHQAMDMFCDKKSAIHIASNPVFHERTKHHIEILDCHLVREKARGLVK